MSKLQNIHIIFLNVSECFISISYVIHEFYRISEHYSHVSVRKYQSCIILKKSLKGKKKFLHTVHNYVEQAGLKYPLRIVQICV